MKTVDEICREIVAREGGYTVDHAGPTNHGVSLRYARRKGLVMDLDGDGDVDGDDILLVTPEHAAELYKIDFYYDPQIDLLPGRIQPVMTDFAVNSGSYRAVYTLQQVLTYVRAESPRYIKYKPLTLDGAIGPVTAAAAKEADAALGPFLNNAICEARERFMRQLANRDPEKYARFVYSIHGGPGGWITRAREFLLPIGES